MKTRHIFTSVILVILLTLINNSGALAVPSQPSSFWGTVKINGSNIPNGWMVYAGCGGHTYASSAYQVYSGDTVYAVNVPTDDPSTGAVEGCTEGQTILFNIGSTLASQSATFHSGTNVQLNLTASDPTSVPATISGNVGIAGATISYNGKQSGSALADVSGNYSFKVSIGWLGMVTPSLSGYSFYPTNRSYVNVIKDWTDQNFTASVGNPPVIPSSFYGTVKTNGANVPLGVAVTARINGQIYAKSYVLLYNGDTVYSLNVPGDDPSTPDIVEGGNNGNMVLFFVGDTQAAQTGTWQSGTNVEIDLTTALPVTTRLYLPLVARK